MPVNSNLGVPDSPLPRVVIVGGGFGGLKAARTLRNKSFQVVLIDKNNYHQFQPLFYQVAMSGLDPSSVSFPLRKIFHKAPNMHIRGATALSIEANSNTLKTDMGDITYDHLLLGMGAGSFFFGNKEFEAHALGMKSVSESLYLRNQMLQMLEDTVTLGAKRNIDIVVVGGGPTGVELCGSLAEMKKMMLPNDYPEIDFNMMKIWLLEGSDRVLSNMGEKSSSKALEYLTKLGVTVKLNAKLISIENDEAVINDGSRIPHKLMLWAAGIKAFKIDGIPSTSLAPNGRILTDGKLKVKGCENVYCVGDQAWVEDPNWPKGHPQVAQPAIQQGALFAKNLIAAQKGKALKNYTYKDLGSMATVGRNLAVAELGKFKPSGFIAWVIWMAVHLMSIVGVKNRLLIFINWLWSYITYDQSLRLLIKPFKKQE